MDAASRVRRGVASRRHEVMRQMRRRYQNTNNRYQSANVAAGLSCQRDADTHVTDTATWVRGEWRHAVAMSNVDTEPLPEHEKPLSIHERDCGLLCQCDAYSNVTGASARVCRGMASRRHEIRRRMRRRYQNTKNRYQSANVTLGA